MKIRTQEEYEILLVSSSIITKYMELFAQRLYFRKMITKIDSQVRPILSDSVVFGDKIFAPRIVLYLRSFLL